METKEDKILEATKKIKFALAIIVCETSIILGCIIGLAIAFIFKL